ncbi:RNA polymerase [Reichenbachiella sp. 5M10]|uniref:RNA polymerase sigma factor n=1 Tax=Reichenbachiella sp. 5M10 TaxID=1889772 RepID=UPI000C62B3C2|nr:RNA polymerase sigma factor [Reichenbachiella sp. 5M10]PIB37387.1 RNA polymerase [Reichenbachiella sp. 5M10]
MKETNHHRELHFELIEGVRRQERSAQHRIYQLYAKAMLNTSYRIVYDLAEAEDVVQEAFVKAFSGIDQFRGDASFGSWLKRIVVNGALNVLKKRKELYGTNEIEEDLAEETSEVWDGLSLEQIKAAIAQLPDGFRVVFSLYLLEGYDHKEIAQILDVTESTSKSQYKRAKDKLREILKTMYNYER